MYVSRYAREKLAGSSCSIRINDTAKLAGQLKHDPAWSAHLSYLLALRRKVRATLARPSVERVT